MNKILYNIIDICNWCKNANFTCEECTDLYGACRRNMAILDLRKYFKTGDEVKSEWILCSKELPRESENVLIQFAWNDKHHDIGYVYYDNVGRLRWYGWLGGYDLDDIVAWMPLPEPYKR